MQQQAVDSSSNWTDGQGQTVYYVPEEKHVAFVDASKIAGDIVAQAELHRKTNTRAGISREAGLKPTVTLTDRYTSTGTSST